MSNAYSALKCFRENAQLFSDPGTTPEKYNLYAGPAYLAQALYDMESRFDQIESGVQRVQGFVHSLK